LTNSSLTQPVFIRWGRNAAVFDAYVGVSGGASQILTGSAQGDFCMRNDSGSLLFSTTTTIKGQCDAAFMWKFWEPSNSVGAAGLFQVATQETGNFTATITGCTTAPTAVVQWRRSGAVVTLDCPGIVALSNSAACTFTGMPAGLTPVRTQRCAALIQSSATNEGGYVSVAGTTLTLIRNNGTGTFLNDGLNKGSGAWTITYNLT